MIFTYILSKIGAKGAVAATAFLVLIGYAGCVRIDNNHLKTQLTHLTLEVAKRDQALAADRDAIAEQNKQVLAYKTQSDYLIARVKAADARVQSLSKTSAGELARIRKASIPTDCAQAASWLGAEAPAIVNRWNHK